MEKGRVVITGVGATTSLGKGVSSLLSGLKNKKSGIKKLPIERFNVDFYSDKYAYLIDQKIVDELVSKDSIFMGELAKLAISEAIEDSGIDITELQGEHTGLSIGTSSGTSIPFMRWMRKKINGTLSDNDVNLIKFCTPLMTGEIANHYKIHGSVSTISTACASGTNAIGLAFDKISQKEHKYMIAGGVDFITELSYSGFSSLQNMSKDICKAFDMESEGLALGDGAGFVILEDYEIAKKRNAKIYAEISGYSFVNDAYHATAPNPDGEFTLYAMKKAMENANKTIEDLDYINAHGTGTITNDTMEYKAIKKFVGNKEVYMSSNKTMIGHTLGAAGAIEVVCTVLGLYFGFIPPNLYTNKSIIDSPNIHLVKEPVEFNIKTAISNSLGFGGNIACIVLNNIY